MFDEQRANDLEEAADLAQELGDVEAELAAREEMEKMRMEVTEKINPKKAGVMGAIGTGFNRGLEQTVVGVTQRVMGGLKKYHQYQIDNFAEKMQSGEIPATQENIDKLDQMQEQVINESKAGDLLSGYEQSARDQYAPTQEERPIASMVGNIGGQMAALPIPGVGQANLAAKVGVGALQSGALGYSQATVGGESENKNAVVGALLGGAVPLVLKPVTSAIGGVYRGVTGQASKKNAELAKYADDRNIPLTTTDLMPADTFSNKAALQLGEKIPFVGTGRLRAQQQKARVEELQKLSDEYGVPSDSEIVASINRKANKLGAAAGKRYDKTITAMGDTPIPLANTIKVIDDQIAKYSRPGAVVPEGELKILKKIKDNMTSGDNTLEILRQNRTLLREGFKNGEVAMTDTAERIHGSVYNAITNDMIAGVSAKLGDDAAASLRQVDGVWAREAVATKNTKLKSIFDKGEITPEKATKMLFNSPASELKILHAALDKKGRENARAAIIQHAFLKAKDSPEKFLSEMDRLKNQSSVFFRGDDKKVLDGAINYLKATQQAAKSAVTTKSGQELIAPGAIAGIIADVKYTGGVGTAVFGTLGASARLYESKPVRNLMIRMANVPPNSTAFEKTANLLSDELAKNAVRIEEAGN